MLNGRQLMGALACGLAAAIAAALVTPAAAPSIPCSRSITDVVLDVAEDFVYDWTVAGGHGHMRGLFDADIELPVIIASRELRVGEALRPGDVTQVMLPEELVPDPALRVPVQVVGRVLGERILKGELIREERLVDPETGKVSKSLEQEKLGGDKGFDIAGWHESIGSDGSVLIIRGGDCGPYGRRDERGATRP